MTADTHAQPTTSFKRIDYTWVIANITLVVLCLAALIACGDPRINNQDKSNARWAAVIGIVFAAIGAVLASRDQKLCNTATCDATTSPQLAQARTWAPTVLALCSLGGFIASAAYILAGDDATTISNTSTLQTAVFRGG